MSEYEPQPDPENVSATIDESAPIEESAPVEEGEVQEPAPVAEPEQPLEQTYTVDQVRGVVQEAINRNNVEWQANVARQPQPEPAAAPADTADPMDEVRARLNMDIQDGQDTFALMDAVRKAVIAEVGGSVSEDRVHEIANQAANSSTDGMRAGLGIEQSINTYVQNGVIDAAGATLLRNTYNQQVAQPEYRDAAASPTNSSYILKSLFADLVTSGQIKTHQARPASPLQSGGGGRGPAPKAEGPDMDEVQKKFPSLRGLKKDQINAAGDTSRGHWKEAHSQR